MILISLALACVFGSPAAGALVASAAPTIEGQYLEVRTCDVYTGPCFANAEVNEVGKEATVAWKVERGEFAGVDLAGTSVVAVLRNRNTFGDIYKAVDPLETAIFTDAAATQPQRDALFAFAKQQLGSLAIATPKTQASSIELATGCCDDKGCAKLRVGDAIAIDTRCVHAEDKHCGNETLFYPPLTSGTEIIPAVATQHRVDTTMFGVRFEDRESRGAMTGRFQLALAPIESAAVLTSVAVASGGFASSVDDPKADGAKQPKAEPASEPKKVELKASATETLPKEIPEAIGKLLDKKGLRLDVDGKPYYELWLRSEVPLLERPKASLAIKYGQIGVGEIVGAMAVHTASGDYKNNAIKAGLYVLRYGIQPEDGDHMGTAPNRDFFVLTSVHDDTDSAAIDDMEKLGELSIKAGEDHPLVCQIRPLAGDAPAQPTLVHDEEHHLWIADLALNGRAKDAKETRAVRVGVVLIGMSEDA